MYIHLPHVRTPDRSPEGWIRSFIGFYLHFGWFIITVVTVVFKPLNNVSKAIGPSPILPFINWWDFNHTTMDRLRHCFILQRLPSGYIAVCYGMDGPFTSMKYGDLYRIFKW